MRLSIGIAVLSGGALAVLAGVAGGSPEAGEPSGRKAAVVELGRRLFFDPAVSRSGTNSCASCHDPEHGWSSPKQRDEDDFTQGSRHSQTLVDAALSPLLHSDGEFLSIEALVAGRIGVPSDKNGYGDLARPPPPSVPTPPPVPAPATPAPSTPGLGGYSPPTDGASSPATPSTSPTPGDDKKESRKRRIAKFRDEDDVDRKIDLSMVEPVEARVEGDGRYAEAFAAAFGTNRVTTARMATAIAAFVRSIRSTESPYDRFAAGDASALSAAAQRGLRLFKGKATCAQCHLVTHGHAPFTDQEFHDTGVVARSFGGAAGIPDDDAVERRVDRGRARITDASTLERAFKTPTLRDVARRGPYMHDGTLRSLEDVVRHYARGAKNDPNLDARLTGFELSDSDVVDLVEFLRSLSGDVPPGLAPDLRERAKTTRVRVLDARGRPLAHLSVRLVPAGDSLPGDVPLTSPERVLETDADGVIEFAPSRKTHVRLILPSGLRAPQGQWIPDTCERLDLALPVEGRATLLLTTPNDCEAMERLLVTVTPEGEKSLERRTGPGVHLPMPVALALRPRRVQFEKEGAAPLAGATLVRYVAWIPFGAPEEGLVTIPVGSARAVRAVSLVAGAETRLDLRDQAPTTPSR
jgi:cytochrome c peroxidase